MRRLSDYPLWLGNAHDARDLKQIYDTGITAIVDLAIEEPPLILGRELVYCRFPFNDGSDNPTWLLAAAIDTVAGFIAAKVPTLVACSAGLSRSPLLAAAAIARVGSLSLDEALSLVAAAGRCDISTALLRDVRPLVGGPST